MSRDIFQKITEAKERHRIKVGENLRERVRSEAKDTMRIIDRLRNKGMTEKEIARDIEKSLRNSRGSE